MQPFLQYRRIREQLQQQLDRHQRNFDRLADTNDDFTTPTPLSVSTGDGFMTDVEKTAGHEKEFQDEWIAELWDRNRYPFRRQSQNTISRDRLSGLKTPQSSASSNDRLRPVHPLEQPTPQLQSTPQLSDSSRTSSRPSRPRPPIRKLGSTLGRRITGVDVRDRKKEEGRDGGKQVFVVDYEGDDDLTNPHNWSYAKRVKTICLLGSIGIIVGIASSIDSSVLKPAADEFVVSKVMESLASGLYLIGFGAGSLFVAPFSETFGRNPVYMSTLALFALSTVGSALAPNIGAQLAFRFLAGLFGSTPLTCAGGTMADLWSPMERTIVFPIFANSAFAGPVLGPVIGGYISQSTVISWRWTEWVTLIGTGVVITGVVLFMPETFAGTLLTWKAKHLRDITGDDRYASPMEIKKETFMAKMKRSVLRPFVMTAREPIIILISLYLTVVYVILFTFLDGYDYIFAEIHGTSPGITGLCFLGILIGLFSACVVIWPVWYLTKRDLAKAKAAGKDRLQPESRLWTAMLGGSVAIPISLFWMAWTSSPNISIWSPIIASVLFGYGVLAVFISCYQYIIDSYEVYSASALAFATLIRYVASGGMVVVGIPFYENVGVPYTLTVLACISAAAAPLPYLFWWWGPAIRKRSKYAVGAERA